jgi:hypothetical protein
VGLDFLCSSRGCRSIRREEAESLAMGKPFPEVSRIRRADDVYRWMLHHKAARLLRTDEEFVMYGASTPTSYFIIPLLLAPASMQSALDIYERSVMCAVLMIARVSTAYG